MLSMISEYTPKDNSLDPIDQKGLIRDVFSRRYPKDIYAEKGSTRAREVAKIRQIGAAIVATSAILGVAGSALNKAKEIHDANTPNSDGSAITYVITPGDTLWDLARDNALHEGANIDTRAAIGDFLKENPELLTPDGDIKPLSVGEAVELPDYNGKVG